MAFVCFEERVGSESEYTYTHTDVYKAYFVYIDTMQFQTVKRQWFEVTWYKRDLRFI